MPSSHRMDQESMRGGYFMRKTEDEQSAVLLRYGKSVLLGSAIGVGICLILLLLASFGISRGLLEASLSYQIVVVICVISSLAGGMFAIRRCPARGLFVGLAVGTALFLLQLTAGLLLYDTLSLENGGIGLVCADLCGGAAAGILGGGGRRGSSKTKKRKKR